MVPEVPPATKWRFPQGVDEISRAAGADEVAGLGADLEPGTVLAAYRGGLFPMPVRRKLLGWWSPDPRGVLPLDGLVVSRSLRRAVARYEIRIDTAGPAVVEACADRSRPGAWINGPIKEAYLRLYRMGWVHSVEAWDDGGLAGGLYGVAIGGLFAGESMFHHRRDASKVALIALVAALQQGGGTLLDVQWATEHLRTLGVIEISRIEYHRRLAGAVDRPQLELASPVGSLPS